MKQKAFGSFSSKYYFFQANTIPAWALHYGGAVATGESCQ
jgi:hypothetical protein